MLKSVEEPELTAAEADPEDYEDGQRGISDGHGGNGKATNGKGKSRKLYCFSCHRLENHYNTLRGKPHHYLLIGMSLGVMSLVGPFRCRCCGYRRLGRYNFLNPKYHYHRWKYSAKTPVAASQVKKPSKRPSRPEAARQATQNGSGPAERVDASLESANQSEQRRSRTKKLRAAPTIDSIGAERRHRQEEQLLTQLSSGRIDFSMEGLIESFETEASRRMKAKLAADNPNREPLVAKKAIPRKKIEGKPKRRHAKKERLTGPTLYCFGCKQNNQHFHRLKGSTIYSFFFGITLGLIMIAGPFRCSICSRSRMFASNLLNPKFYVRRFIERSGDGYS